MKPRNPIAVLTLLFAAAQLLPQPLSPKPQSPSTAQTPDPKPQTPASLRIGLWTLWHDNQLTIEPTPQPLNPKPQTPPPSASARPAPPSP